MGTGTPFWLHIFGLVLALSGWGKLVFDYVTGKPRVRGRLLEVMRGQMSHPQNGAVLTTFTAYLYLLNTRRNSVHILDYEMEIKDQGKWVRLDRVYGLHANQEINFTDASENRIEIEKFAENLIYRKNVPAEYGKPLHGWIVFVGSVDLCRRAIKEYRVTCVDAYRKRHSFEANSDEFERLSLVQEIAGIQFASTTNSKAGTGGAA